MNTNGKSSGMRWTALVVSSTLLVASTIHRMTLGMEADSNLCMVFISVAGLSFGVTIASYFRK